MSTENNIYAVCDGLKNRIADLEWEIRQKSAALAAWDKASSNTHLALSKFYAACKDVPQLLRWSATAWDTRNTQMALDCRCAADAIEAAMGDEVKP
jgi:hypothetical protein